MRQEANPLIMTPQRPRFMRRHFPPFLMPHSHSSASSILFCLPSLSLIISLIDLKLSKWRGNLKVPENCSHMQRAQILLAGNKTKTNEI